MSTRGSGVRNLTPPKHQPDAAISQVNPVSTTLYTVLNTTEKVRIIRISANITWAVTQPTPLEVVITIDGQTITHGFVNPVSTAWYLPYLRSEFAPNLQLMLLLDATEEFRRGGNFLYEGRSVQVQARVTWAVTQPTPLVCRVKYAKW